MRTYTHTHLPPLETTEKREVRRHCEMSTAKSVARTAAGARKKCVGRSTLLAFSLSILLPTSPYHYKWLPVDVQPLTDLLWWTCQQQQSPFHRLRRSCLGFQTGMNCLGGGGQGTKCRSTAEIERTAVLAVAFSS